MQETQIEIYFDRNPDGFRFYLFFLFFINKILNYQIKINKKKVTVILETTPSKKLKIIRKLFILNYFDIKKVITTY
jgi:hypothetical protein